MKRKREMSEDECEPTEREPKPKIIKKKSSKFKQLVMINITMFTLLVIPLLAIIGKIDHKNVLVSVDKVFGERCYSDYWKPKNLTLLKSSLDGNLFGQHIAKSVITSALSRCWKSQPDKALVMSFHGWTGSGKNFVAKFIAESLFRRGIKSNHVHIYVSTVHFHDERKVSEYQQNLRDWILGNVTRCSDAIFIFDEVDKMPVRILDALKPFMDHHSIINGIDMSNVLFILLSNTGGREITQKSFEFWQNGRIRNELRYADYERLTLKGAYNEVGGLQKSIIIDKSLIDVYVPFLPLEQKHVRQCVERELISRGYEPDQVGHDFYDQVIGDLVFWPADTQIYSSTGCKRVSQKVDQILYELDL